MVPKCMMGQGLEMHCGSNKPMRLQWEYTKNGFFHENWVINVRIRHLISRKYPIWCLFTVSMTTAKNARQNIMKSLKFDKILILSVFVQKISNFGRVFRYFY